MHFLTLVEVEVQDQEDMSAVPGANPLSGIGFSWSFHTWSLPVPSSLSPKTVVPCNCCTWWRGQDANLAPRCSSTGDNLAHVATPADLFLTSPMCQPLRASSSPSWPLGHLICLGTPSTFQNTVSILHPSTSHHSLTLFTLNIQHPQNAPSYFPHNLTSNASNNDLTSTIKLSLHSIWMCGYCITDDWTFQRSET